MRKQKGFTLIELLVVIAIIGLLSTLAVVALNNARMKARDARRVSDIKQIQTALELFYNDASGYPTNITAPVQFNGVTYMADVPTNPSPIDSEVAGCPAANAAYTYTPTGSWPYTSYNLTYCLGALTGGLDPGIHTASPSGISQ